MTRIQCIHTYEHIISVENLLLAWGEFVRGKKYKKDVLLFERNLMSNILNLHDELRAKIYTHGAYYAFNISDPKPRNIHKASVKDRIVHHSLYRVLYPFFDRTFIVDSYSCRCGKGTHRAMQRFRVMLNKVSKNNTKTVWVLKCDIRKFFASIDHSTLNGILEEYISDKDILHLLGGIINSFHSRNNGVGLPLGNLTSQLFVNMYMNEFDQFVKHTIKAKYYIRYADDFIFLSQDKIYLENILLEIRVFLDVFLKLKLHPDKVFISTLSSGVDFLGWIHFPYYKVLRTATKKRMLRNIIKTKNNTHTIISYTGMLSHGNTYKLKIKYLEYN